MNRRRKVRGEIRAAIPGIAVLAVTLATAGGCKTLPDVDRGMPVADSVQTAAQGRLADRCSRPMIDDAAAAMARHLACDQLINADSPLVAGNKLTLLQDGPATYAAMFTAIRSARDHINLETYIFDDDEIGAQFADLLLERSAAGVQVNLIYDSVGGLLTPPAFFARLRDGGVAVLEFNPVNPLNERGGDWLLNNRDHRRQLLIDGRIAFTGGVNISDSYASAPSRRSRKGAAPQLSGWRDTHLRIEGPVVADFQRMFIETWGRQNGAPLAPRDYFPALSPQGEQQVRVVGSSPRDPQNLIYLSLISAISHAQSQVHLTIAYFAPDPQLLQAMKQAAARGVDVVLILPSHTDSWAIFHLGRSYYTQLLRSGVRIHERRGAVMHAKTASIDGVWSTVGSTNLDWRSLLHNDEINAVILSHGFAARMGQMFAADLGESDAITLALWRQRSLWMRVKEQTARLGAYWL